MKLYIFYINFFLLIAFSFAVNTCCAQSFKEIGPKSLTKDSTILNVCPTLNTTMPIMSQKSGLTAISESENKIMPFHKAESYNEQDSIKHINIANTYPIYENRLLGVNHLGLYAISSENSYINLLKSRNAAFMLNYHVDNFYIETGIIANQYETRGTTTQLGINSFLEYKFSQQWSLAVYGTIYNNNPYFSMATYPFVETSSYGGWIKYQGDKVGMKLGIRKYYDAFQKQWKMEPIITPSFKISKKVLLELPVGPAVQKYMERLFKSRTNNSPIITPNF